MKQSGKTRHPAAQTSIGGDDDGKDRVTIRIEDRDIVERLTQVTEMEESNRKDFVQKILRLLLLSKEGQQLQGLAENRDRSVVSELSSWMKLLQDNVDWKEVGDLAKESQRYPEQMIVYLIRLGLSTYKRQLNAKEDAQGNSVIL